jgi:hypothetical protein
LIKDVSLVFRRTIGIVTPKIAKFVLAIPITIQMQEDVSLVQAIKYGMETLASDARLELTMMLIPDNVCHVQLV